MSIDNGAKTKRYGMRMYEEDYNKLTYWSEKYDVDRSELLIDAMDHYIKWKNGDYDLPRAETQRTNQMIDSVDNMAVALDNFTSIFINGMDSIVGIAKGSNMLTDDDDGDL